MNFNVKDLIADGVATITALRLRAVCNLISNERLTGCV